MFGVISMAKMTTKNSNANALLLLLGLMTWLMTGCYLWDSGHSDHYPDGKSTPLPALRLYSLSNCDDYRKHLEESLFRSWTQGYGYVLEGDVAMDAPNNANSEAAQNKTTPDGISQTNNQELGVDEADLVKTAADGTLYILQGSHLYVEAGFPPKDLKRRASLDLGVPTDKLYLDDTGHRLVVIASGGGYAMAGRSTRPMTTVQSFAPAYSQYQVIFIDIAVPEQPVVSGRLYLDGWQVDSRRVGQRVHLVSRFENPMPEALTLDKEFWRLLQQYQEVRWNQVDKGTSDPQLAQLEQQLRARISSALDTVAVAQLLPQAKWEHNGETQTLSLLSCQDISRPQVEGRAGLQIISSFNMDGGNLQSTAITGDAWEIYGRPESLYLAQRSDFWWWTDAGKEQTVIHKFNISDGVARYQASGVVDGWIKDQFSLGEQDGFLRLATTSLLVGTDGQRTPSNDVFVLADTGNGDLAVHGAVRGFAPGERIFSVRWVKSRGYVVTFRNIDPLFTFDMSDPAQPRLAGEIEIPGFSTYMHPIDDTHLLTIGNGGNANGATNGVQLQLFDVADLAHPRLAFSHIPVGDTDGYSWSEAMYNHLAFTYYAPRKLLVIPLTAYTPNSGQSFSGFALFRVDTDAGITTLGWVDHKDLAYQGLCAPGILSPDQYQQNCTEGGYVYFAWPRRAVIMTAADRTYLYSISNAGLKATDVEAPDQGLGSDAFDIF